MTLTEVMQLKQAFKRPCWSVVITLTDQQLFEICEFQETKLAATLELFPEDLIATDYVIVNSTKVNLINSNL